MNSRSKTHIFFFLLCFLIAGLLAGCCGADKLPSATISTTAVPSDTPRPTANGTLTAQMAGTQTQAGWTATFQASTQEVYARETAGAANNATLEAGFYLTNTAVVETLLTRVTPQVYQSMRSPDGKWLAQIIQYPCTQVRTGAEYGPDAYEIIRVSDRDVEEQYYSCGGLGAYGFEGKFWTSNSRYFYYTNGREGWPDGGYPWRRPISRYDVLTDKTETLWLGLFSPDQNLVAGAQGHNLVILGTDNEAAHPYTGMPADQASFYVNWLAWSPAGDRLAYLTQANATDTYPGPTTLNLVDVRDWNQTLLLDASMPPMLTVEWQDANTLLLGGADFTSQWTFDLRQNTLARIEPTPTPEPAASQTPRS